MIRPITLWPFPNAPIAAAASKVKAFLSVELSMGQMIEDVRLSLDERVPVHHFGRMGGIVMDPDEVLRALKDKFEITL